MLDEAVAVFGRTLEARCDEAAHDAKDSKAAERAVKRVMDDVLGVTATAAVKRPRRKYRYEVDASGLPRPVAIGGGD